MQKRDEAIEYYKNQLEQKEKLHNEEIRLLSSIYHQLSFKCAKIKEQSKNPKLNLKDILN
jgi:prefoldin subunit 5